MKTIDLELLIWLILLVAICILLSVLFGGQGYIAQWW